MKLKFLGFFCCLVILLHATVRLTGIGSPVLVQPDRACGYVFKPNQQIHRLFAHLHINQYGMRSDDLLPKSQKHRVMFLGDSMTYATSRIDQARMFTSQIGAKLGVDILNASASAWAIPNEVGYLDSRGDFGSQLVVFVLNPGDLSQRRSEISSIGGPVYLSRPRIAEIEIIDRLFRLRSVDAGDSTSLTGHEVMDANLDLLEKEARIHRIAIIFIPFRKDPGASASAKSSLEMWTSHHGIPMLDVSPILARKGVEAITFDGFHLNERGHDLVAQAAAPWISRLMESRGR